MKNWLLLILVVLLLSGCGEELLDEIDAGLDTLNTELDAINAALDEDTVESTETAVADDSNAATYIDESVEYVDLLIDGGCKDGEVFNEADESCSVSFTCDDAEACAQWGNDIVTELTDMYGSLVEEEAVATDEELVVLTKYEVDLDSEILETEDDVTQETVDYHAGLWYSYAWLIPEEARTDMNRFEVFDSGSTLAYVVIHDDYAEQWKLGMNRKNLELASETMVTYIHEFAHLLSLRGTEVDYYVEDESECAGYYLDDRCYFDDAYIAYYYDQFYLYDQEQTLDYYVSDYAMSSIVEDFAETFAHFVLTPQPDGNTVREEKILFFYQFSELVELRADILARAATWLDRTVVD